MNLDIEQQFIGTLVQNNDRVFEVMEIISPCDFVAQEAAVIYSLVSDLVKAGEEATLPVIYAKISSKQNVASWLLNSIKDVIPFNLLGQAREIAAAARKRRISLRLSVISSLSKTETTTDEIMHNMYELYKDEAGTLKNKSGDIKSVLSRFEQVVEFNAHNGLGLRTGFKALDDIYARYRPGHLWVVGGWTSVGKTAFMIEAVSRLLNKNIMIISTEMTEDQNVARILANQTGINSNVILSGHMLDKHACRVDARLLALKESKLHIYDDIRTVSGIEMQAKKNYMRTGLMPDVIFVDFIQNLIAKGNKYEAISQIAVSLQKMAHTLNCCIVALSQLPNQAAREDAGILEFKGAGEIAAAADVGILLKRSKESKQVVLLDVRKNRHGPLCQTVLEFDRGFTSLSELPADECGPAD